MRTIAIGALTIGLVSCSSDQSDQEARVRAVVADFYRNFGEGFTEPADYATEDWNHINPYGGRDQGREATMKDVRAVRQSFLKETTDSVEHMDVRFASGEVAIATVIRVMSPFTDPGGGKHGAERHIRTFVVVKRGERWRIMQDHNTTIVNPANP